MSDFNLLWAIWICCGWFEFAVGDLNLLWAIWICCGRFVICCERFEFAVRDLQFAVSIWFWFYSCGPPLVIVIDIKVNVVFQVAFGSTHREFVTLVHPKWQRRLKHAPRFRPDSDKRTNFPKLYIGSTRNSWCYAVSPIADRSNDRF